MALYGTLDTMPVTELLQWISLSQKTGTLEIFTESGAARISFQNGDLIFCSSSDEALSLSNLLLSSGALSAEVHQRASLIGDECGVGLGKVLLDLNVLRQDDLQRFLIRKVENEILRLFQSHKGHFQFVDHELPGLDLLPLKLDVTEALLRVSQRMDEATLVE